MVRLAMRIARADVRRYRGSVEGARGATVRWTEREGLLLRLATPEGAVGQGEASPLPGYSARDTIDGARAALETVDWSRLPEADPGEPAASYLIRLGEQLSTSSPSARFAVETALLDLLGQARGLPIWALFDAGEGTPVPLSTLVGGADDESSVARARAAAEKGSHTIKLKLQGPHLGAQLDALGRIREAIGGRALRLDANQSFSPETVCDELDTLTNIRPELVEEPVPTALLAGLAPLPVPTALDESLQEPEALGRLSPRLASLGVVALVLKPTALGGYQACLRLAAEAKLLGLDVTVSHLFDGPVALAAASHLALAVASRTRASGLDRHGGLGAWPDVRVPLIAPTTVVAGAAPGLGLAALPERP